MSRFTVELKQAVAVQSEALNSAWKGAVAQAFTQVVLKTPVDQGTARASWLIGFQNDGSVGTRPINITPNDIPDVGQNFLLYSNLPYTSVLEFGLYPQPGTEKTVDGYSAQAPQGMVRITVADWPTIVARFER